MENVVELRPAKKYNVSLTGAEWLALMLKLAGRGHDVMAAESAEAKMLQQLNFAEG